MMVNKDFCLSSFIAYRYIYRDDVNFYEGMTHKNYKLPTNVILVESADDIDRTIKKQVDDLYKKYNNIGVLL